MATKHFTDKELACHCGCGFLPTQDFQNKLEELRIRFGKPITVTSAARCAAYNKQIGGAPDSYHVKGEAADLQVTDRWELAQDIFWLGYFRGVGIAASFIHIDTRPIANAVIYKYSNK